MLGIRSDYEAGIELDRHCNLVFKRASSKESSASKLFPTNSLNMLYKSESEI